MNAHIAGRNVVVTVAGTTDAPEVRTAARKAACGEAHTATIGKLLKVADGPKGVTYTWGPVTPRGTRKAAAPASNAGADAATLLAAAIGGDQDARERLVALLTIGEAPVRPAPTAKRETFAPIAKRAAKREAAACKVCEDLGHVRKTPRDNGSVAYRTAKGRDASIALGNAKACEAKGCKSGKAARKAA